MDAKEVLLQFDNYTRKEKFLRSEILQENKLIDALDLPPVRMTRQAKEKLSQLEDHIKIYEEDLDRISIEKKRILDLISQIPGVEGEVLKRRYVDGEIWEDICEGVSYSWQGVFKIHRRALRMVQDLLDQSDLFDT